MKHITHALVLIPFLLSCSKKTAPPPQDMPSHEEEKTSVARTQAAPAPRESVETATSDAATNLPKRLTTSSGSQPGKKADFSVYLLALSWAPNFCDDPEHKGKEQCKTLAGTFAAKHLTLHGLWPNYDDQQAAEHHKQGSKLNWPEFCTPYDSCEKQGPATCNPDADSIPAEMKTYGPGYVTDHNFLADHEWPKHGSCTGLDSGTYFSEAIKALLSLPGDKGTPKALADSIGGKVKASDLRAAFEHSDSVVLACDTKCNLQQVGICLKNGPDGMPDGRVACPSNVAQSSSDNGCMVKNRCPSITIQSVAHGADQKCSNPGQGPACVNDKECKTTGYKRCAKSGCCTNEPLHGH